MKNLIDALKVLTGRKLSQKQMKSAILQEGDRDMRHYIVPEGGESEVSEVHKYTDGKFAWFTTRTSFMTTKDVSAERNQTYSGDYVEKAVKREYNEQGLLTEKIITLTPQIYSHWRTIVYSLPGSFFGRIDNNRSTY